MKILGSFPKITPPWRQLFELILRLRDCIHRNEKKSKDTKVIELRNTLLDLEGPLRRLGLTPPPLQSDFQIYWDSFADWLLKEFRALADGRQ